MGTITIRNYNTLLNLLSGMERYPNLVGKYNSSRPPTLLNIFYNKTKFKWLHFVTKWLHNFGAKIENLGCWSDGTILL